MRESRERKKEKKKKKVRLALQMWILYLLRIFDCYLQLFLRMWFLKKTRKDLSTMNRIKGSLLEYAFKKHAFEYGDLNSENVLIFVGGLTDKLATVPYVPFLSGELNKMGWSVVQIEFTSSHIGWGTGSLARDHSEIAELVRFLKSKQGGARKKIGIMGHSTGCQNTIYLGWVCVTLEEQITARIMLDNEHEDLQASPGDDNIYILGQMGKHNVAIVRPPTVGLASAVRVMTSMTRTFPKI